MAHPASLPPSLGRALLARPLPLLPRHDHGACMVAAVPARAGSRHVGVPGQRRSGDGSGHHQGSHDDGQRRCQAHRTSHAGVPHRRVEGLGVAANHRHDASDPGTCADLPPVPWENRRRRSTFGASRQARLNHPIGPGRSDYGSVIDLGRMPSRRMPETIVFLCPSRSFIQGSSATSGTRGPGGPQRQPRCSSRIVSRLVLSAWVAGAVLSRPTGRALGMPLPTATGGHSGQPWLLRIASGLTVRRRSRTRTSLQLRLPSS
jgi:hypothetical protein